MSEMAGRKFLVTTHAPPGAIVNGKWEWRITDLNTGHVIAASGCRYKFRGTAEYQGRKYMARLEAKDNP